MLPPVSPDKIKARYFHSTKCFIDELRAINAGREFGRSFRDISPKELELKVEHQGRHTRFLIFGYNHQRRGLYI